MRSDAALKLVLVATALVLAFSPASVLASGFQLMEQNGSGLGNAEGECSGNCSVDGIASPLQYGYAGLF
jgi:hypothetical protein